MEWVEYRSPMPLQTQVLYIFPRVGKFQGHFHFRGASEKAFFPAYAMVICCVTANITAGF